MKRILTSAAIVFLAATAGITAGAANPSLAAATPGAYVVESAHTRVQFSVSHLGFTNWYGDFTGATGALSLDPKNIAASKLDIVIPVASVSTTNAKLDGELKSADWFDAERFPTIHFVATDVTPTGSNEAKITGNLTFHGVTKPVVLAATFNGAGVNPLNKKYTVGFDASTVIKRSEFGVKTYVPMVGDDATLRISAAFEKAQ